MINNLRDSNTTPHDKHLKMMEAIKMEIYFLVPICCMVPDVNLERIHGFHNAKLCIVS